jgi:hypothetical protein
MADNNIPLYPHTSGSIGGFDASEKSGNVPPVGTGFSLAALYEYLQNGENFVSQSFLMEQEEQIDDHLADFSNPHRVTVEQVTPVYIDTIVSKVMPGTVPDLPPMWSLIAAYNLPFINGTLQNITPVTNRYRTRNGGVMEVASQYGVDSYGDFTLGIGTVPLFNDITYTNTGTWDSQAGVLVNTTFGTDQTLGGYPFNFKTIRETNTYGVFGVDIASTTVASTGYTTTFYLKRERAGSVFKVFCKGDPDSYTLIDFDSQSTTIVNDGPAVRMAPIRGDVSRVSVRYRTRATNPSQGISVRYYDDAEDLSDRNGLSPRAIFAVAHAFTSRALGNQPTPVSLSATTYCSGQTIDLSYFVGYPQMDALTGSFTYDFAVDNKGADFSVPVLTLDKIVVVRNRDTVFFSVDGTIRAALGLSDGVNTFAFSYTRGRIAFKINDLPRVTITGSFPRLDITALTFGKCDGHLISANLYAMGDNHQTLEFLTDVRA